MVTAGDGGDADMIKIAPCFIEPNGSFCCYISARFDEEAGGSYAQHGDNPEASAFFVGVNFEDRWPGSHGYEPLIEWIERIHAYEARGEGMQ